MSTSYLNSEDYDERAHQFYEAGDFDGALRLLREGLCRFPHAVDLHIGLGYTWLACEEYAWARKAFDAALALDSDDPDALVGLGDVLLRFGEQVAALDLFDRVRAGCTGLDLDLLLTMGRALYREGLYGEAQEFFLQAFVSNPRCAEALAALGFTFHRLGESAAARSALRRALALDRQLHDAAVFLGHIYYERGEWAAARRLFSGVPAAEHRDELAIRRLVEMCLLGKGAQHDEETLGPWLARLIALTIEPDPVDQLLTEVAERAKASRAGDEPGRALRRPEAYCVTTADGQVFAGSWLEIVRQLRDAYGEPGESVAGFMRRRAEEERSIRGADIPADDPERFLRESARVGLIRIER